MHLGFMWMCMFYVIYRYKGVLNSSCIFICNWLCICNIWVQTWNFLAEMASVLCLYSWRFLKMQTLFSYFSMTDFNKDCKCDKFPCLQCIYVGVTQYRLLPGCLIAFLSFPYISFPPKLYFLCSGWSITSWLAAWLFGIWTAYPVGLKRIMVANGILGNISI